MRDRTEYSRLWYQKNHAREAAKRKAWHVNNRERSRQISRDRYAKKRKQIIAQTLAHRRANRPKYNLAQKRRRQTDSNYRIKCSLRSRINIALRDKSKSAPTLKLLGCSLDDLWLYLESKFTEGMSRENYGLVWNIDHIIPCALFDLTKAEHQKRCFHFSNLQPMFVKENCSKNAKLLTNQFLLL